MLRMEDTIWLCPKFGFIYATMVVRADESVSLRNELRTIKI